MINIWIIFFTQYSQKEIDDLLIRISTINQKIQSYTFFNFFLSFHEQMEGQKWPLGNYFKLNAPRRKGDPQRKKQKNNPTHIPPRKSGLNCFGK